MANDILTSIRGRRFGLGPVGELLLDKGSGPQIIPALAYNLAAAGVAVTASSAETAAASYTIPANTLQPGSLIRVRYQGIATATNSSDTLTVKLYTGGIGGTVLISHAATDATNNDVFTGEYELTIRTVGATGTMVGVGFYKSVPAAEGTMISRDDILASTTIDTTIDQALTLSLTWSTANAGNSARVDFFRVLIA